MSILSSAANRTLLSDWVPYRGITNEGVVRLAGNGLMAIVEYRGPNFSIVPNHDMKRVSDSVARRIGEHGKQDGWTINFIFHNFLSDGYLQPERHVAEHNVINKIGGDTGYIDAVRARRFDNKLFDNRTFIALTYRPNSALAEKFETIIKKNVQNSYDDWENYLGKFKNEVSTTASFMNDLMMDGGGWARICTADEVLSVLDFEMGGEKSSIRFPEGSLSCNVRSHVDCRLVWEDNLYIDGRPKKYVRCVNIKGLPEFHNPEMMTTLRTLGFAFKVSQRFTIMDVNALNSKMKRQLRILEDSKHGMLHNLIGFFRPGGKHSFKADTMASRRADAADNEIGNEAFAQCGGYLTTTAVVWGDTPAEANDMATLIKQRLVSFGFKSDIEDANEFPAYIGSFPSVQGRNKRSDLLTEKFAAYRTPLSSPWTGADKSGSEFGGPPLMQCVTQGTMPFRFDLFGRKGGGGHTVMFGQNGTGKSTLARVIAKQFLARFKPMFPESSVIDFDVDSDKSSSIVACLSSGGNYLSLKHAMISMQPLRDIDDNEARLQATFIIRSIVEVQGFTYSAMIGAAIERALDLLVTMPKNLRTLSMLRTQSDMSELRHALADYCQGGPFGAFMDGDSDAFELSPWTLFEFGDIITKDPRTRPIISSVLYRTQRALDGKAPRLMIIDEAKVLCMALGHEQLIKWLAECRKKLGIVFMNFHEIDSETTRSGITDALMSQCDTRIFFPRGDSKDSRVRSWMESFGVTDTLAMDLASAQGRQVLVIQGDNKKAMVDFVIGKEELALCGVNGADNNQVSIELYKRVGKDRFWIEHLKSKGFDNVEQVVEEWKCGKDGGVDIWGRKQEEAA